jgi:hypothetical protein
MNCRSFLFQKQPNKLILTSPPPKYIHSYLLNPGSNVVSLGEHILTQAAEMWYNLINIERGDLVETIQCPECSVSIGEDEICCPFCDTGILSQLIIKGDLIKATKGYVIQNAKGEYLASALYWYEHDCPEEAWVHPECSINTIRKMSEDWEDKPTSKTKAEYSKESETVVLEEPEDF